jgi:hypothetical protein
MFEDLPLEEFAKLGKLRYPIDTKITNEMIMSTPDTWNGIQLDVEVIWHPNYLEFGCVITSPEGHDSACAEPTDALDAAVEEFVRLHKTFGQVMSKVTCIATKDGESWRMKSTME